MSGSKWTQAELDFLADNYRTHDGEWGGWAEGIPGRTWRAIKNKARLVGILKNGDWDDSEKKRLLLAIKAVSDQLGKTPEQVVRMAYGLMSQATRGRHDAD